LDSALKAELYQKGIIMSNCKVICISALVVVTSVVSAFADCSNIVGADAVKDGTWLARLNGKWRPVAELNSFIADRRSREVSFTYVVKESEPTTFRRGVLVIKTGIRIPAAETGDRVTLAREAYRPIEQCESYPAFPGGDVRGRSYDGYHDYSYSAEKDDQNLITSFHVTYARRAQRCKRSNDDTSDSYFTGHYQSNRSQFSFDERVVANGQYSQFFAQFGVAPAYANTSMSDRRVEMKRYNSDKNGLACVGFSVVVKPGIFIRINDLEQRIGLFRAPEQSWDWPR
jgi:hypothetical protein